MKNNNQFTTEELLEKGKGVSLSTAEHNVMKAELLSYANYHGTKEREQHKAPWFSLVWVRTIVVSSLTVLLFVGTGYASIGSLPGEPLYAMKVSVVEEMIAYTKTEPSEFIAYKLSLMEARLDELHLFANQVGAPVTKDLVLLSEQIEEHIIDITETLNTSGITHQKKIATLSKLSGISQAQKEVVGNEVSLSVIVDNIQDIRDTTSDALKDAVENFVDEQSAELVNNYLSDQLTLLSEEVTASTTSENVRDSAEQHFNDVNEALIEGDVEEAIISTLEAEQIIIVDAYMDELNVDYETSGEIEARLNVPGMP